MTKTLYQRITVDQVISTSPVKIYALIITSDGNGDADAGVYDGESTSDNKIVTLYTVDESLASIIFAEPLETQRGLFIDIGSNVTEVLVQYTSERE